MSMDILLDDLIWMSYNILLAYIPIFLGLRMLQVKNTTIKLLLGFLWLLFIPNTIYMLTDIIHLFEDWPSNALLINLFVFIPLYTTLMIISILTFIAALLPFEKVLKQKKVPQPTRTIIIVLLNCLIAFGVVLGRIQRLNSWDVFLNPEGVITNTIHTLTTPSLLALTLLFAVICNVIYLFYRNSLHELSIHVT